MKANYKEYLLQSSYRTKDIIITYRERFAGIFFIPYLAEILELT